MTVQNTFGTLASISSVVVVLKKHTRMIIIATIAAVIGTTGVMSSISQSYVEPVQSSMIINTIQATTLATEQESLANSLSETKIEIILEPTNQAVFSASSSEQHHLMIDNGMVTVDSIQIPTSDYQDDSTVVNVSDSASNNGSLIITMSSSSSNESNDGNDASVQGESSTRSRIRIRSSQERSVND